MQANEAPMLPSTAMTLMSGCMQDATAAAANRLAEQPVLEAAEVPASEAKAAEPEASEAESVGPFVDGNNSGTNSLLDKLSPVGEANHASHVARAVDHGM